METQINPGSQNQDLSHNTSALRKSIEESKKELAQTVQSATPAGLKRGPGRPRKNTPNDNGVGAVKDAESEQAAASMPPPDISLFIKTPLKMVSKIPATKYQIPELAFTDDEAMDCAQALNGLVNAFVPNMNSMDPKTAAVIGACSVFGSVGFQKYMIYQDKIKERRLEAQKDAEKSEEIKTPGVPFNSIPAENYFKTQNI